MVKPYQTINPPMFRSILQFPFFKARCKSVTRHKKKGDTETRLRRFPPFPQVTVQSLHLGGNYGQVINLVGGIPSGKLT